MVIPAGNDAAPRVRLPRVAVVFLSVSPILLVVGTLSMLGTPGRYINPELPQVVFGKAMLLVGIVSLLAGLIIVAVRAIAQQQTDILLRAGRAPQEYDASVGSVEN